MDLQRHQFSQMAEEKMCSESKHSYGFAGTICISFAISCAMGKDEKKPKRRISAKNHDGGKPRKTSKKKRNQNMVPGI